MTRYAANTEVSADRTRGEIERTLTRYGARGFMYGWDESRAVLGEAFEQAVRQWCCRPARRSARSSAPESKRHTEQARLLRSCRHTNRKS